MAEWGLVGALGLLVKESNAIRSQPSTRERGKGKMCLRSDDIRSAHRVLSESVVELILRVSLRERERGRVSSELGLKRRKRDSEGWTHEVRRRLVGARRERSVSTEKHGGVESWVKGRRVRVALVLQYRSLSSRRSASRPGSTLVRAFEKRKGKEIRRTQSNPPGVFFALPLPSTMASKTVSDTVCQPVTFGSIPALVARAGRARPIWVKSRGMAGKEESQLKTLSVT
jgi:hypothetical protein